MAKKKNKALSYVKEVRAELKKVTWPSFKQVKNNTLVVLACVLVIGALIWVLDYGFASVWNVVSPAETVEQVETDATAQEQQLSEEEYQAMIEETIKALDANGINFNQETGEYTDKETGTVLTQEEVNARMGIEEPVAETQPEGETPAQ